MSQSLPLAPPTLSVCLVAYLGGLVRHQRHLRCRELFAFLEFDAHSTTDQPAAKFDGSPRADRAGQSQFDVLEATVNVPSPLPTGDENETRLETEEGVVVPSILEPAQSIAPVQPSAEERWRRLFVNMRVHLKPTAVAVRCRLFEGVITGSDICVWLVQSQYKYAQDSSEACMIGQELVNAGLLLPISCGFSEDGDDGSDAGSGYSSEDEEPREEAKDEGGRNGSGGSDKRDDSTDTASVKLLESAVSRDGAMAKLAMRRALLFSIAEGYLYRYPSKSSTTGSVGTYTLLGSMVHVTIAQWAKREAVDEELGKVKGQSLGARFSEAGEIERKLEARTEGQGFIHYEVTVRHHNDEWSCWRR